MERGHELEALLAPAASQWGVDLSPAVPRLVSYAELLLEWGARVNLTGARSLRDLALAHFADVFPLLRLLPDRGRWVDVGSGAGLPGLLIAVLRPDLDGTLLEPLQKRRAFLTTAKRALALDNVVILPDRVAEHTAIAEPYRFAVSRAVFPIAEWIEIGQQLVGSGGDIFGFATRSSAPSDPAVELLSYDVGAGPRAIVRVRR